MAPPDTEHPVDRLRDELKALGYLDARVGRFVLGGAVERARPAALAAAASVRIGLLAGILLGPAAAIGLRWRAPGLITRTGDAVVLAVYLAILFGIAAAAVAFAVTWAASLLARRTASSSHWPARARRAAAAAGIIVGAACLAYLTLWWRVAIDTASSASVAWTGAVLAVAVAISLLLGRAVTVTVLALLARLGFGAALSPGLPGSSWKATAALAVVALAGAGLLLVETSPEALSSLRGLKLTVVPTGQRVVVIAIDGVDTATIDRLHQSGRLPHLSELLGRGEATMPPDADRDPARVWTTIATGQPPERHGISALESRQVAGIEGQVAAPSPAWSALAAATDLIRLTRPAIASGDQRLIPAFWEVAAHAGLRTAVVHWWATWPAPPDLGIVMSDRAVLRLERGGALDGEIAPSSLYDALRQTWPARRQRAHALATQVVPPGAPDAVASVLERSAELDATLAGLAADPSLGLLDLVTVYLPGLDIAQHALFGTPDGVALAPSVAAGRAASIEEYYVFLDNLLGATLLAGPANGRVVVLVTQPGRVSQPTNGLLAVSGEPAVASHADAQPTDVAPTILYALGVPVARDLAGQPALALFDAAFVAAHPVRPVPSYGSRLAGPRPTSGQPLDREMIDRLRSLGYVR